MSKRRTIAVVTGTRAEFGLLTSVIRAIDQHPELRLRLIVTGTHLTTGTRKDVSAQFHIDAKVPMQRLGVVGREADVAALGRGVIGLGKTFAKLKPDVVLVLGDRIEAFAAASAASIGGIRIGHIHGGDRAEGVADEAMRHAISKLSHLHFPTTALSRKRLIRMGEPPKGVFNVGSPAIDELNGLSAEDAPEGPPAIVLQHPIGASDAQEASWMAATLHAVSRVFDREPLVIGPNSDPGSDGVRRAIRLFSKRKGIDRFHLPREQFLTFLASADVIVGNSSAGLIEAAALKVPCVNIGPRQSGREKPNNVIDCDYGEENVGRALRRAMRMDRRRIRHPYGDGRAGERIAEVLVRLDLNKATVRKRNAY